MTIVANTIDTPVVVSGAWTETGTIGYYDHCWFAWSTSQTTNETLNFSDTGDVWIYPSHTDAVNGTNVVFSGFVDPGNYSIPTTAGGTLYIDYSFTGSGDVTISGTGAAAVANSADLYCPRPTMSSYGGGSADITAPTAILESAGHTMTSTAELIAPSPIALGYGGASSSLSCPTASIGAFGGAFALISSPASTLYATGHDSTGEQSANLSAPNPLLVAYGGANCTLTGPGPTLAITATVTNWGQAALAAPTPALSASGTVAATAQASLSAPMASLIGYSGAVCSITLIDSPTLTASGTTGGIGGAALTCPLFELTANGTAQNHGSANLLAPSPRMGATAQAYLIAPGATLTAIGTAVVTASYEAYAINLNHNDPAANNEVTRYTNFPFTQIVRYQGSYFGVAADGLYLLEGTTDDGAPIPWDFKTAMTDFKSPFLKTVVSAYFGGRLGPAATVDLHVGEDGATSYSYTTVRSDHAQRYRQKFGRGLSANYYALGAAGAGVLELDNIEFETLNSNRRL